MCVSLKAMHGSKGAHRPRSKRAVAQPQNVALTTQAQASPPLQREDLPHIDTTLGSTQHGEYPQVTHHWIPVVTLQPGARLPRPSELLGYPPRQRISAPNLPQLPSDRTVTPAGARESLDSLPMGANCNSTPIATPARGDALQPTAASRKLLSISDPDQLSASRGVVDASEQSVSSDTSYADASSVCFQSEGMVAQAAAQAAARKALDSVQRVMSRLRLAEHPHPRHSPQVSRQRHRRVRRSQRSHKSDWEAESTVSGIQGKRGSEGLSKPREMMTEAGGSKASPAVEVPPSQWEWLMEGVMGQIINALDSVSVQRIRQVCRSLSMVYGPGYTFLCLSCCD